MKGLTTTTPSKREMHSLLNKFRVERVAEFYKTSRTTVYRWINKFSLVIENTPKLDKPVIDKNEFKAYIKQGLTLRDIAKKLDLDLDTVIMYSRRKEVQDDR